MSRKATRRKGWRLWVALVTLLALIAAACGTEEAAAPEDPPDPAPDAEAPDEEASDEEDVAQDPDVTFEGETLRFVVGFGAGGGFDVVARLIARRLSDRLPGNPNVIVQNMPGAASMVAANTVFQMQPGDGRTFAMFHFGVVVDQIMGAEEAQFDAFEWNWVGESSGEIDPVAIFVRDDLGIETIEDLRDADQTIFFGSPNRGAPSAVLTELLEDAGWPVETIYGFDGASEVFLALQQGELDAISITSRSAAEHLDMLTTLGSLGSATRLEERGIPEIRDHDLGFTEDEAAFLDFLHQATSHVRLFALPPGTPPERVAALRDAFEAVLTDPEVMAEVEALDIEPGFTSGAIVEETIHGLLEADPDVVDMYREHATE